MQAYIDWELGLVAQLERDATHGFWVCSAPRTPDVGAPAVPGRMAVGRRVRIGGTVGTDSTWVPSAPTAIWPWSASSTAS